MYIGEYMGGLRSGIGLFIEGKDTGNEEWLHNSVSMKNDGALLMGDTYQISLSSRFNNCHHELENALREVEGMDYRLLREL